MLHFLLFPHHKKGCQGDCDDKRTKHNGNNNTGCDFWFCEIFDSPYKTKDKNVHKYNLAKLSVYIYWRVWRSAINKAGFMCMYRDTLRRRKIACIYTGLFSKHVVALWKSKHKSGSTSYGFCLNGFTVTCLQHFANRHCMSIMIVLQ